MPNDISPQLHYAVDQGVATITINRPEKLNALLDSVLDGRPVASGT